MSNNSIHIGNVYYHKDTLAEIKITNIHYTCNEVIITYISANEFAHLNVTDFLALTTPTRSSFTFYKICQLAGYPILTESTSFACLPNNRMYVNSSTGVFYIFCKLDSGTWEWKPVIASYPEEQDLVSIHTPLSIFDIAGLPSNPITTFINNLTLNILKNSFK